jgi:bacterioferritin (cytochrome b1)
MNTNKIVSSYLKKIRARDKAPQDFIDELNKDLSLEYSAAIQYIQHANMLAGAAEETFAK